MLAQRGGRSSMASVDDTLDMVAAARGGAQAGRSSSTSPQAEAKPEDCIDSVTRSLQTREAARPRSQLPWRDSISDTLLIDTSETVASGESGVGPRALTASTPARVEAAVEKEVSQEVPLDVAAADATPPTNPGSVGHPEVCGRACRFFVSGRCDQHNCTFCHLEHTGWDDGLHRAHRGHLQEMPAESAKALIIPILAEKVRAFDNTGETEAALQRLVAACGAPGTVIVRKSRSDRWLVSALRRTNARLLLACLRRSVLLPGEEEAQAAAQELMTRMRLAAAPGGAPPMQPTASRTGVWSL